MKTEKAIVNPILSIIIPCYNSEATLEETLESVILQDFYHWEAIIVNDGSQDNIEEIALKWVVKDNRYKYFKKENGGLGTARNFGIEYSKGIYILPLDSDNKVAPHFAKNALKSFKADETIGVVHGNACYFGEKSGLWKVAVFDFEKILLQNYIDACAIFKKSLWLQVNGYDTDMPHQGNEDWEFWLALGKIKTKFCHLNEVTFFYRVTKNSMIRSYSKEMFNENRAYIGKKYSQENFTYFKRNYALINYYNANPLKAVFVFFKKWIKSLYVFI